MRPYARPGKLCMGAQFHRPSWRARDEGGYIAEEPYMLYDSISCFAEASRSVGEVLMAHTKTIS
jgi:hypothetical protein